MHDIHRRDAEIAERESFLICPEKYSGQIKSFQPFRHEASGESASHRFSRINILSPRSSRLERVRPLRDEWAVKKSFEDVNYFLLPAVR
jgi:hypothetical protein